MPETAETYRFVIAFSFAGPHRDKVRAMAELVSAQIDPALPRDASTGEIMRSEGRVFFDEWFEHEILGDDMDVLLQRIYHEQSLMVIADLSEEYAERPWCQAEARAIRALRFSINPARDETSRLRLLNARLGENSGPAAFRTTAYLDAIGKTADQCAALILKRLTLLARRTGFPLATPPAAGPAAESRLLSVYLAIETGPDELTPDMELRFMNAVRTLLRDQDLNFKSKRKAGGSVLLFFHFKPSQTETLLRALMAEELDAILGVTVTLYESTPDGNFRAHRANTVSAEGQHVPGPGVPGAAAAALPPVPAPAPVPVPVERVRALRAAARLDEHRLRRLLLIPVAP